MQRPPRRAQESIIGAPLLLQGLLQGSCLLAASLGIYAVALNGGSGEDEARTLAIVGLTAGNLLLVWLNASAGIGWRRMLQRELLAFWSIAGATCIVFAAAIALPAVRHLLHFGAPAASALATAIGATAASVVLAALISRVARCRRATPA